MSRWWLVALAGFAGILLWVMATWPLPAEVETTEDAAADSELVPTEQAPPSPAPDPTPPPTAAATPAEPAAAEQPAPPTAAAQPESPEAEADKIFTRENGPLAEYKARFDKEPRDSAAGDAERLVRDAFVLQDGPKPVFRAVLCRETICRIETRLSLDSMGAYVAGMTRMVHWKFDGNLASERSALAEAGEVTLTVYAKRPPPAQ